MSRQFIPKYAVGIVRDAFVSNRKFAIQMGIADMLKSSIPFYWIHFIYVIQCQRFFTWVLSTHRQYIIKSNEHHEVLFFKHVRK